MFSFLASFNNLFSVKKLFYCILLNLNPNKPCFLIKMMQNRFFADKMLIDCYKIVFKM